MLEDILSKSTLTDLASLKSAFSNNKPFKHVVIDSFLREGFAEQMLDQFPTFDEKLALNENGDVGRKAVHEKVTDLGPVYKELDGIIQTPAFLDWISQVTGIEKLKYDPYYFGGGTHNNLHGQDLDPHVDFTHHPISGDHRRLNLIIYLNEEWNKEWGGNIEFHKNPRLEPSEDQIISVKPIFNRAVIFETNNISWHGFPMIDLPESRRNQSRKSFALYFYTDFRDENVAPHSTIYVERHLPKDYQVGMEFTAQRLHEIKTLLKRRDQHLERLYNNITNLMTEVRDLKYLQGIKSEEYSKEVETIKRRYQEDGTSKNSDLLLRIYQLENSTSWKITKPLRKLKKLLTKPFNKAG